jgi:hypothetical protein
MNTITPDIPVSPVSPVEISSFTTKARRAPFRAKVTSLTQRRKPVIIEKTHHIIALVNVGWGNSLYLRGEGGCLSWDVGVSLCCVGEDRWVFAYPANNPPKSFKFLLNDIVWELGDNHLCDKEEISLHIPHFPEG